MSESPTFLDPAAALRAATGFTDVGDALDAVGRELGDAGASMRWGDDPAGAALVTRHAARAAELADTVATLAQQLRGLHEEVRTAAGGLTGTDAATSAVTADLDRGRGAVPWV